MEQSPRLSLSYVMPAQAQKHVTVNETFRRLDQLVQQSVLSRTLAAEPAAPNEGDAYILTASPTGASWSAYAQNNIAAFQDGAWTEIAASEGFSAWVGDADEFVIYDGALWNPVSGGSSETAAKFGVNTTADATNKFAVKSNAILFDALDVAESGTGDSQIKVNKEAVGDTASHLFQTGFSGRAEFGLTGDDDFHIKVSPDNFSTTYDALIFDKDTGNADFTYNVSINRTTPTTFWSSSKSLWMEYGYFGSNGSFGIGLFWNGYRDNTVSWTSQGINSFTSGGGVEINNTGVLLRHEDPPSGVSPQIALQAKQSSVNPGVDNTTTCGSSSLRWSTVYAATGAINTSDRRLKTDVENAELGLDFILDLKARSFRWLDGGRKYSGRNDEEGAPIYDIVPGKRRHYGLVAQEVKESVEKFEVQDFGGWVLTDINDPESTQGLRYDQFIPVLIKAVQELAAENRALAEKLSR